MNRFVQVWVRSRLKWSLWSKWVLPIYSYLFAFKSLHCALKAVQESSKDSYFFACMCVHSSPPPPPPPHTHTYSPHTNTHTCTNTSTFSFSLSLSLSLSHSLTHSLSDRYVHMGTVEHDSHFHLYLNPCK